MTAGDVHLLDYTTFSMKLEEALGDSHEGRELATEMTAFLFDDYFESGLPFEEWFARRKSMSPLTLDLKYPNCVICQRLEALGVEHEKINSYHESKIGMENFPPRIREALAELYEELDSNIHLVKSVSHGD